MSRGLNKVTLIGNLGTDPDVRYSPNGTAVCKFSLATSESVPVGDGQYEEKTEWHRIVTFGKLAENAGSYLKKGRQAYVEGKLRTNKWEDREGITRYTTEIVAQQMIFLGGGAEGQGGQERQAESPAGDHVPEGDSNFSDDIPF